MKLEDLEKRRQTRQGDRRGPSVLYEDEWIVAFDKPAGLLVAPDRWDKSRENLMDIVHARISPQVFHAHRLDRETSGVLLCAKSKEVLRRLCADFEDHASGREYVALVQGIPHGEEGRVSVALEPDPRCPGRMRTNQWGRPAETEYSVIDRWRGYALLLVRPVTGRTHQIRVHLASIECPIVGDGFYGRGRGLLLSDLKTGSKNKPEGEKPLLGRLALHAARLRLRHPTTAAPLTIESPVPSDFETAIKHLDRFAARADGPLKRWRFPLGWLRF